LADARAGLAGPPSGSLLDPRRPDYFRTVARLGMQAALALAHAHEQGVLHRDVKPSNLLVDAQGNIHITDFGLPRSHSDIASLTATGQMVGTPRYLPPEAFAGEWHHSGDVYSLGLTLYEMVALRPAFAATNPLQLLEQVLRGTPLPPRRLNPDVPPALEAIILRAIRRQPAQRHASAGELAEDLRRFLAHQGRGTPTARPHASAQCAAIVV